MHGKSQIIAMRTCHRLLHPKILIPILLPLLSKFGLFCIWLIGHCQIFLPPGETAVNSTDNLLQLIRKYTSRPDQRRAILYQLLIYYIQHRPRFRIKTIIL